MTKLTIGDIRSIVAALKQKGFEIGLRDISFILLCRMYSDRPLAYRSVFGDAAPVPFLSYNVMEKITELESFMNSHFPVDEAKSPAVEEPEKEQRGDEKNGMTYDEIKSGLEDDLMRLIALRDSIDASEEEAGEKKDVKEYTALLARIADIRVKLTEKFGTTQTEVDGRVQVLNKYDSVCPYCGHEISVKTVYVSKE